MIADGVEMVLMVVYFNVNLILNHRIIPYNITAAINNFLQTVEKLSIDG